MAVDEALLDESDRTGGAFLRLYRFSPPCLSLGRNEPARARYDRAAITRLGITVVRRPTGGRAVWHEHEVTYAVAAPLAALGEGSVRDRKSTRLNSSHVEISYAVFCLKKKKQSEKR